MSNNALRYNSNKRKWRNIPLYLFEPVIMVGEYGEKKYTTETSSGTLNFLKGLPITDTLDSIKRHLKSFESPHESDLDEESGLNHILHCAWNCIALYETLQRHPNLDDRYKLPKAAINEKKNTDDLYAKVFKPYLADIDVTTEVMELDKKYEMATKTIKKSKKKRKVR